MRIVLADNHPQRLLELRRLVAACAAECQPMDGVSYENLAKRLAEAPAHVALVACGGDPRSWLTAVREAHGLGTVPVLACGPGEDSELARLALENGCCDYLPIEQLADVLPLALVDLARNGTQTPGKLIAVFSPCGGAGVSTTAVNLAVGLAREKENKVALVDLHAAPGDLALMLNIEARHTLDELCRFWQRLDRQMIARSLVAHRSGVSVLAQRGCPAEGGLLENTLSPMAVRRVIGLLRQTHTATVLDMPSAIDDSAYEALGLADVVALVARPDVPGLRRARWALDTLGQMGLGRDRFRLVLNRASGRGRVSAEQAEEALGIEVFQSIPEDANAANRAVNEGIPLAELSGLSQINRSFIALARSVNG